MNHFYCFESQLLLINSKLLVTINDLLKYYLISETDQLKKKFPDVSIFHKSEDDSKEKTYKEKEEEDIQESTSFKKNFYKMSTKQISLLTQLFYYKLWLIVGINLILYMEV